MADTYDPPDGIAPTEENDPAVQAALWQEARRVQEERELARAIAASRALAQQSIQIASPSARHPQPSNHQRRPSQTYWRPGDTQEADEDFPLVNTHSTVSAGDFDPHTRMENELILQSTGYRPSGSRKSTPAPPPLPAHRNVAFFLPPRPSSTTSTATTYATSERYSPSAPNFPSQPRRGSFSSASASVGVPPPSQSTPPPSAPIPIRAPRPRPIHTSSASSPHQFVPVSSLNNDSDLSGRHSPFTPSSRTGSPAFRRPTTPTVPTNRPIAANGQPTRVNRRPSLLSGLAPSASPTSERFRTGSPNLTRTSGAPGANSPYNGGWHPHIATSSSPNTNFHGYVPQGKYAQGEPGSSYSSNKGLPGSPDTMRAPYRPPQPEGGFSDWQSTRDAGSSASLMTSSSSFSQRISPSATHAAPSPSQSSPTGADWDLVSSSLSSESSGFSFAMSTLDEDRVDDAGWVLPGSDTESDFAILQWDTVPDNEKGKGKGKQTPTRSRPRRLSTARPNEYNTWGARLSVLEPDMYNTVSELAANRFKEHESTAVLGDDWMCRSCKGPLLYGHEGRLEEIEFGVANLLAPDHGVSQLEKRLQRSCPTCEKVYCRGCNEVVGIVCLRERPCAQRIYCAVFEILSVFDEDVLQQIGGSADYNLYIEAPGSKKTINATFSVLLRYLDPLSTKRGDRDVEPIPNILILIHLSLLWPVIRALLSRTSFGAWYMGINDQKMYLKLMLLLTGMAQEWGYPEVGLAQVAEVRRSCGLRRWMHKEAEIEFGEPQICLRDLVQPLLREDEEFMKQVRRRPTAGNGRELCQAILNFADAMSTLEERRKRD
ncbi:hypothetical protein CYLTODRAFT_418418 [Cylindrobasidium torrendii FP15055 ss-10]|uniref:Uncharacterized protein n=1 Tax=Cylindrobasidium torrendii FP15055 ss-10 TaxID=1314674 RepID=A0A0D7BN41_9AGAR|nr:hypothetical protein CYLTODRAFT_418418 [Cylindrobasidium torrendii FP15055 ss-10]